MAFYGESFAMSGLFGVWSECRPAKAKKKSVGKKTEEYQGLRMDQVA